MDGAREVPHYDIETDGGSWDGTCYTLADGTVVTEAFFCDGTYTYYLQKDGTPMKDCLTYHPDGEHIIYFDEKGHEAFDSNEHITASIAGDAVDDDCYFGTYGYMYVDETAYVNSIPRYYNAYGVLQKDGAFSFTDGNLGVADAKGNLQSNGFGYDAFGQKVFFQWNGTMAKGLITDGSYYYQMDETDGHLIGTFPVEGVSSTGIPCDSAAIGPQKYDMRLMGDNPITNEITDWSAGSDVSTFMNKRYGDQYWRLDIYRDANGNVVNSATGETGTYATLRGITIGSSKAQVRAQYGEPWAFGSAQPTQYDSASDNDWYRVREESFSKYAVNGLEKACTETWGIRFTYDKNDVVTKISFHKYPIQTEWNQMVYDAADILETTYHIRDIQPVTTAPEGQTATLDASVSSYATEGCTYQWSSISTGMMYSAIQDATAPDYQIKVSASEAYYKCTITQQNGAKYDVMFVVRPDVAE